MPDQFPLAPERIDTTYMATRTDLIADAKGDSAQPCLARVDE
jgi:hypothetical protein